MTEEFEEGMRRRRAEMQARRDIRIDVVATIFNYWKDGNSSGKLKMDPSYLLRKWFGPQMCMLRNVDFESRMEVSKEYRLSGSHVDLVINTVCKMLNHLCNCGDPELELAGDYARKQAFRSMSICGAVEKSE